MNSTNAYGRARARVQLVIILILLGMALLGGMLHATA